MRWTLMPLVWRSLLFLWMTTIFILSTQSSLPTQSLFEGQDKFEHLLAYGLLGVLLSRSLNPMKVVTWQRVILITVLTTLYGISDEYHQSFVPGRDVSALDVLADGVGGFVAAQVLFWWDRKMFQISQFFPSHLGGARMGGLSAGHPPASSLRGEGRGEG